MNKKFIIIWLIIFCLLIIIKMDVKLGGTSSGTSIIDNSTFVDNTGNLIEVGKPKMKIISLYKEHTTNLFYLGLGNRIIGVDEGSTFPIEVKDLPRYSYKRKSDIQKIIHAKPDLVLISTELNDKHPAFVTGLEASGLKVVSLRPNSLDEFPIYIEKLAMLTGTQDSFKLELEKFNKKIDQINLTASKTDEKVNVFVETSESGYYTTSDGSLTDIAIDLSNGINLGKGSPSEYDKSSKAYFGLDKIKKIKDDIDVYITLVGGENPGALMVSLMQKEDFRDIKAIKNKRVYEIDRDMIDNYSFRYLTGLNEFARIIHPEIFDDYDSLKNDRILSRENFAHIVYKVLHTPTYINVASDYYEHKRFSHLYGNFKDVNWRDDDFDIIETVAMRSYLTNFKEEKGNEYFHRDKAVTREEIAGFINMLYDLNVEDSNDTIVDINTCSYPSIVKKVVASGYMKLENERFNPQGNITNREFIKILENLPKTYENIKE